MARPAQKRSLGVWLNGLRVGTWSSGSASNSEFRYEEAWLDHPQARPISLSLPLAEPGFSYRGPLVSAFFENLLPDSSEIRQRIKSRYAAASISAYDLLSEVGRDCVGAIQLLPDEETPERLDHIEGRPIDDHEIATILKGLTAPGIGGQLRDDGCWQLPTDMPRIIQYSSNEAVGSSRRLCMTSCQPTRYLDMVLLVSRRKN